MGETPINILFSLCDSSAAATRVCVASLWYTRSGRGKGVVCSGGSEGGE